MQIVRHVVRSAAAGALILLCSAAASPQSDRAVLLALRGVQPGQWELREDGSAPRRLCLSNPATLLQLRHGSTPCSQIVFENSAQVATVHYTCPGHGHGRTTVSVETPRLVHVETQGVIDGAPFSDDYEARRTGACP